MPSLRRLLRAALPARAHPLLNWIRDRSWDAWHNVTTVGDVELASLEVTGPNRGYGVLYQPTPARFLKMILVNLEIDYSQYTFVDFGSGKGRVVLVATGFPFIGVVGVEFAEELHNIAMKNVSTYRGAPVQCENIECLHQDAARFEIPISPLVLFFHNPFGEPVMSAVVDNLQRSLDSYPREVWIICSGPGTQTSIIEQLSGIQLVSRDEEDYLATYCVKHQRTTSPSS